MLIAISTCCFGQRNFNSLYDYNAQVEAFSCVVQIADSGYLAVGTSKNNSIGYNYYVLRTNKKGNKTYESFFEIPQTEIILNSIKKVSDTTFIATGIIIDQDSTTLRYNRDVLQVKMTIDGDTLWTKRFRLGIGTPSNPDFETGQDVIVTSDKGFAILGNTSNSVSLGYQIYLIKTDSLGNLLWEKTFGGSNTDIAYTLLETKDKGFIMSGYTLSYGAGDRDGYVIKTDSLGNVQWQRVYGGAGSDGTGGITKSLEGGYLLTGWTNTNISQPLALQPWVIKIDNNGNQQWDKKFGSSKTRGDLEKVIQLNDSNYVAIGGIKDTLGMRNAAWILKIKQNGDSLWAREYKRAVSQDDYIYNFAPTNDAGFILTGSVPSSGTTSGTQDGWLIKTDCLGADSITYYFGDSCYIGSPTTIKELTINTNYATLLDNYPNPFSSSTIIPYYMLEENVRGELTITDVTGRQLQKYNLEKGFNTIEFKTHDLKNGIYYYTMMVDGKTISTKKIVIIK